jgi:UDP-N-acetylglucosamine 2-epimerase (non-hydrolysing)
MKIISVVGARPNFMKIAPFIRAIEVHNAGGKLPKVNHILVHTGQHYDDRMSKSFFQTLGIPEADINLEIGSGSHAEQVGKTMIAFEQTLQKEAPDWVVVVGDVNATLACSVTAKKMHIKVCHIEAGLRSGDEKMPEEINRLVTDRLSDLLLTPDKLSTDNLINEGIAPNKIKFVGNIMIDTLEENRKKAEQLDINNILASNHLQGQNIVKIEPNEYGIITMHRPSNVDHADRLKSIINFFADETTKDLPLIWPIHPRTQQRLKSFGLWKKVLNEKNLILLHPIGYHEMVRLNSTARIMFTDSGGLQEECCVLGTPCLTLRWNTERPITLVKHGGVSKLVGNNISKIQSAYKEFLHSGRKPQRPEKWDGKTAIRCLDAILNL